MAAVLGFHMMGMDQEMSKRMDNRAARVECNRVWLGVWLPGWIFFVLSTLSAQPLYGQKVKVTAESVETAIENGVNYLLSKQDPISGKWAGHEDQGCGQTALVVLALLNCMKDGAKHPKVAKAIEYLRSVEPKRTYECALHCMVLCTANPKRDAELIRRDIAFLVETQLQGGGEFGGWTYPIPRGDADPSNSQFALLGLMEAQRVGFAVPRDTLMHAYSYWRKLQNRDGGWAYSAILGGNSTGSMTAAGIASLLIAEDALDANGDALIKGDRIQCCNGNQAPTAVDLGVGWLSRNYSIQSNPQGNGYLTYYLYALERVGRLTGLRFIGDHDWYREGCELLLQRQDIQGFFPSDSSMHPSTDTSFALLFLAKGKRQMVIGRIDYRHPEIQENDWALHRRAIQNLTGFIERAWDRPLAWQTIELHKAKLVDLLECKVLFISGRNKIQWTANDKVLLKEFVQQGGFLFAEACDGDGCDGKAFEQSFRALMEELFDEPLRKLAPTHPIWNAETKIDPQTLPEGFWLYGLEQCCRTSVVFSPISLSCRWDILKPFGNQPEVDAKTLADLQNGAKIGINVVSYATGRGDLKQKLDDVQALQPQADLSPSMRGTLVLPKLQHAGGADDVPRAIPNLLETIRREVKTHVSTKPLMIAPSDQDLSQHALVYVHGRQRFAWSSEQRNALRKFFVEKGGFLLGDAICANTDFADSLRNELREILPEAVLQRVPVEHEMLTERFQGYNVQRVTIVDPGPDAKKGAPIQKRTGPPVLEMLVWNDGIKDRVVAIFSPLDISCALESRGTSQCKGYIAQDAAKIATNMILYALLK